MVWKARGEDRVSLGRLNEIHALWPGIHSWRYSPEKPSLTCPRGLYQDTQGLVTMAPNGDRLSSQTVEQTWRVVVQWCVIQQLSEAQPFATRMDLTNITQNKRSQAKRGESTVWFPFSAAWGRGAGRGERRPGVGAPWGRLAWRDWHSSGEEGTCGAHLWGCPALTGLGSGDRVVSFVFIKLSVESSCPGEEWDGNTCAVGGHPLPGKPSAEAPPAVKWVPVSKWRPLHG